MNLGTSCVATAAVRVAKRLIARGCEIRNFKTSSYGTCYLKARILGVNFCVRVADHYGQTKAPNGNLYYVRVDDPHKGTNEPLSVFVHRVGMSRFD